MQTGMTDNSRAISELLERSHALRKRLEEHAKTDFWLPEREELKRKAGLGDVAGSLPPPSGLPARSAVKGYGLRNDGTSKGSGFLGEIKLSDGSAATGLSIGVDFGKGEQEIPLLVPTLTAEEIRSIKAGNITNSITQKAIAHAEERMAKGKSPFWSDVPEMEQPPSALSAVQPSVVEELEPEMRTIAGKKEVFSGYLHYDADGDSGTITMMVGGNPKDIHARFQGLDTLEMSQGEFGQMGKEGLKGIVGDKGDVKVVPLDEDRYGRTLVRLFTADGRPVSEEMVRQGMAVAMHQYPMLGGSMGVQRAELEAAREGRGLWSPEHLSDDDPDSYVWSRPDVYRRHARVQKAVDKRGGGELSPPARAHKPKTFASDEDLLTYLHSDEFKDLKRRIHERDSRGVERGAYKKTGDMVPPMSALRPVAMHRPSREDVSFGEDVLRGLAMGVRGVMQGFHGSMALVHGDTYKKAHHLDSFDDLVRKTQDRMISMPEFTSIRSPGDLGHWVAGQAGALAPIVGAIMAGGFTGGKLGAAAGPYGAIAGGVIGSFTAGYMLYAGGMYGDIVAAGADVNEARRAALLYGIPASAVSIVVPMATLGAITGYMGKDFVRRGVRKMVHGALLAAPAEGVAEALAETCVIFAEESVLGKRMTDDEKYLRIINAGTAGALMGGLMGVVGHGARRTGSVDSMLDTMLDDTVRQSQSVDHIEMRNTLIKLLEASEDKTEWHEDLLRYLKTEDAGAQEAAKAIGSRRLNVAEREIAAVRKRVLSRSKEENNAQFDILLGLMEDGVRLTGEQALELAILRANEGHLMERTLRPAGEAEEGTSPPEVSTEGEGAEEGIDESLDAAERAASFPEATLRSESGKPLSIQEVLDVFRKIGSFEKDSAVLYPPQGDVEGPATKAVVRLQDGRRVGIELVSEIPINPRVFEETYGRPPTAEELALGAEGYSTVSEKTGIPVIRLQANQAGEVTIGHEVYHVLEDMGVVSKRDRVILDISLRKNGIEPTPESRAYLLQELIVGRKPAEGNLLRSLVAKARQFIAEVLGLAGLRSPFDIASDIRTGKLLAEDAQGRASTAEGMSEPGAQPGEPSAPRKARPVRKATTRRKGKPRIAKTIGAERKGRPGPRFSVGESGRETALGLETPHNVKRIISGGQTGADIAGVMAGKALGYETGGTMPRGFKTAEGVRPEYAHDYGMTEHKDSSYVPRTMQNVDNADATIAFFRGRGIGTKQTIGYAQTQKWAIGTNQTMMDGYKPVLVVTTAKPAQAVHEIQAFLRETGAETINIAGHREGSVPGLGAFVEAVLTEALGPAKAVATEAVSAEAPKARAGAAKARPARITEQAPLIPEDQAARSISTEGINLRGMRADTVIGTHGIGNAVSDLILGPEWARIKQVREGRLEKAEEAFFDFMDKHSVLYKKRPGQTDAELSYTRIVAPGKGGVSVVRYIDKSAPQGEQLKHMNNTVAGERGCLGNPYLTMSASIKHGVEGYSVQEATVRFKRDFLRRLRDDPEFLAYVESLRGKKIEYFWPHNATSHAKVIQEWLNSPVTSEGRKGKAFDPATAALVPPRKPKVYKDKKRNAEVQASYLRELDTFREARRLQAHYYLAREEMTARGKQRPPVSPFYKPAKDSYSPGDTVYFLDAGQEFEISKAARGGATILTITNAEAGYVQLKVNEYFKAHRGVLTGSKALKHTAFRKILTDKNYIPSFREVQQFSGHKEAKHLIELIVYARTREALSRVLHENGYVESGDGEWTPNNIHHALTETLGTSVEGLHDEISSLPQLVRMVYEGAVGEVPVYPRDQAPRSFTLAPPRFGDIIATKLGLDAVHDSPVIGMVEEAILNYGITDKGLALQVLGELKQSVGEGNLVDAVNTLGETGRQFRASVEQMEAERLASEGLRPLDSRELGELGQEILERHGFTDAERQNMLASMFRAIKQSGHSREVSYSLFRDTLRSYYGEEMADKAMAVVDELLDLTRKGVPLELTETAFYEENIVKDLAGELEQLRRELVRDSEELDGETLRDMMEGGAGEEGSAVSEYLATGEFSPNAARQVRLIEPSGWKVALEGAGISTLHPQVAAYIARLRQARTSAERANINSEFDAVSDQYSTRNRAAFKAAYYMSRWSFANSVARLYEIDAMRKRMAREQEFLPKRISRIEKIPLKQRTLEERIELQQMKARLQSFDKILARLDREYRIETRTEMKDGKEVQVKDYKGTLAGIRNAYVAMPGYARALVDRALQIQEARVAKKAADYDKAVKPLWAILRKIQEAEGTPISIDRQAPRHYPVEIGNIMEALLSDTKRVYESLTRRAHREGEALLTNEALEIERYAISAGTRSVLGSPKETTGKAAIKAVRNLYDEILTPVPDSVADKAFTSYLLKGDIASFFDTVKLMYAEGVKLADLSSMKNYKDIAPGAGRWVDPTRLIQSIDQGYFGGLIQKYVLWPTRSGMLAKNRWTDGKKNLVADILESNKLDKKKLRRALAEALEATATDKDGKIIFNEGNIKPFTAGKNALYHSLTAAEKARVVKASEALRKLLDDMYHEQNRAREAYGHKRIGYVAGYLTHMREATLWNKLRGDWQRAHDPKAVFDPLMADKKWLLHEMKRTGLLDKATMEADPVVLISDYIDASGSHIFYSPLIKNVKDHIAVLRELKLRNSADALEQWLAETYLGKQPGVYDLLPGYGKKVIDAAGKVIKATVPKGVSASAYGAAMVARRGALALRRGLSAAVFPLNIAWTAFVQTASLGVTVARYGPDVSIGALRYLRDKKFHDYINRLAYSKAVKNRFVGSMAYQDLGLQTGKMKRLDATALHKVEYLANFMTQKVESALTGHAIAAAYIHGQRLGLKGRALHEYAQEGGAKTQSMYNQEDLPGMLRCKMVGAMAPFQTFAFDMMNTVRELNLVGVRNVLGKTGIYETISASSPQGKAEISRRMGIVATWAAFMLVNNALTDKFIRRNVWEVSSFVPFYAHIMGMLGDSHKARGMPVPAQYARDFWRSAGLMIEYGDMKPLRRWALKYHVLAGSQINNTLQGIEAVSAGGVYNVRGQLIYPVRGTSEAAKAVILGPYRTEAASKKFADKGRKDRKSR